MDIFMRLVHSRYRTELLDDIKGVSRSVIIPRLEKVEWCIYVGLIRNDRFPDEGFSLTLWESKENAITHESRSIGRINATHYPDKAE